VIRFVPALSALAGFPTAWTGYHTIFRAMDGLLESLDEEADIAVRGGGGERSAETSTPLVSTSEISRCGMSSSGRS
jgi:hypothetical protein